MLAAAPQVSLDMLGHAATVVKFLACYCLGVRHEPGGVAEGVDDASPEGSAAAFGSFCDFAQQLAGKLQVWRLMHAL